MPLDDFRAVFLPYCLQKRPDGRYAVLNREYKPVGFFTRDFITYEDHPVLVELAGLTPRVAAQLSHKGDPDVDEIFLYLGAELKRPGGMEAYFERLKILAKLKVKPQR